MPPLAKEPGRKPRRRLLDPACWQNESLYRIEGARRARDEARRRLLAALLDHQRYEDEARARAMALRLAIQEREEQAARRRERYFEAHGRYGRNPERDAWICNQRVAGGTLREISEAAGLSLERVRQICEKWERRRLAWWLG